MIGLPTSLLAWVPNYLYPIIPGEDYENPALQHIFIILVVGWLVIFGPKRKGETKIAKKVAADQKTVDEHRKKIELEKKNKALEKKKK